MQEYLRIPNLSGGSSAVWMVPEVSAQSASCYPKDAQNIRELIFLLLDRQGRLVILELASKILKIAKMILEEIFSVMTVAARSNQRN